MTDTLADNVLDFPAIDPWWDLYLPATFGEHDAVLEALDSAEVGLRPDARGDLYAVAARALAVLGRAVDCERLAAQAIAFGGEEAEALATFVAPDGLDRTLRRMEAGTRPGVRADAACDRAALLVMSGSLVDARAAAERALSLCPGHAEASRWIRWLGSDADIAAEVRAARDPRRCRRVGKVPRDAAALLPLRRMGWVSPERYERRLLGTPPRSAWAPAGTALGRLQDTGVRDCYFALGHEYVSLPYDHPLVALEIAADALRAEVEEGRATEAGCHALWALARAQDREAQDDAAQLLAGLTTTDPRLARVGMEVVGWLVNARPDSAPLWDGYLALLSHLADLPSAVDRARSVLFARPAEPIAFRMAIAVLRLRGEEEEAERHLRAARNEPTLASTALDLLDETTTEPFRMVVSGRLQPRWPRGRAW